MCVGYSAVSLDTPHLFNLPSRRDSNALPPSLFPSLPQFTIVTTNFLMMFVIKCHDGEASVTAQDDAGAFVVGGNSFYSPG